VIGPGEHVHGLQPVEAEVEDNGAGDLGRFLMQKEISVGTIDLLLAYIAIETNTALYSLDHHFPAIAEYAPLRLY
jgi:hypothetical protein